MPDPKILALKVLYFDHRPFVASSELFKLIMPNSRRYYHRWIKLNVTDQPQGLPKKGRDYVFTSEVNGSYRPDPRQGSSHIELLFSLAFARELCYQAKTLSSEAVREMLYQLS